MSIWSDFVKRLEERAAECRKALEGLEAGKIQTCERIVGGPWVDTTQRDIERNKQDILTYETLIAQARTENQI
jgi:hypothetical protein